MWSTHYMKTFWNHTYDWLQKRSIKLIFFVNKSIDSKKIAIFPWFLGIPYMALWSDVWNKELLTLRNFFVMTKKFLKAKFDCTWIAIWCKGVIQMIHPFGNSISSVQKPLDLTTPAKYRRKMRIINLNFQIKKLISLACRVVWKPDFSWYVLMFK